MPDPAKDLVPDLVPDLVSDLVSDLVLAGTLAHRPVCSLYRLCARTGLRLECFEVEYRNDFLSSSPGASRPLRKLEGRCFSEKGVSLFFLHARMLFSIAKGGPTPSSVYVCTPKSQMFGRLVAWISVCTFSVERRFRNVYILLVPVLVLYQHRSIQVKCRLTSAFVPVRVDA